MTTLDQLKRGRSDETEWSVAYQIIVLNGFYGIHGQPPPGSIR